MVYKRAHAVSRSSGTDLATALEQELKGALRKEGLSSHPSESGKSTDMVPKDVSAVPRRNNGPLNCVFSFCRAAGSEAKEGEREGT